MTSSLQKTQQFQEDVLTTIRDELKEFKAEVKQEVKELWKEGCQVGAVHKVRIEQIQQDNQRQFKSISGLGKDVAAIKAVANGPRRAAAWTAGGVSGGIGIVIVILAKLEKIIHFFSNLNGGQ